MTARTIQPAAEALIKPQAIAVERAKPASRMLYIDNIRTFLTILVLLHHLMITYAGSGSWIYNENRQDLATTILGSIFCSTNQAYFMGLFLLISAYFVPGAFDRKGPARFWKDRLMRLGIPLALYSWVLHPVFVYWFLKTTEGIPVTFRTFYTSQYFIYGNLIGQGPLWFIETLLIFTLFYAAWRWYASLRQIQAPSVERPVSSSFPSNRTIALFGLGMTLASFAVRLAFPMDWNFTPLNLQFPYFAQYIIMFIVGLVAYRRGWLANLPDEAGRFWLKVAGIVFLTYVPGALLGGALETDQPFKGGLHWQSMFYSLWEAYICLGLCIGVLYLFRRYLNHQGGLAAFLSRAAYGAYVIHMPVITIVTLQLRSLDFHPLLKFGMASLVAVPLTFTIAGLLCRLPYAERVL